MPKGQKSRRLQLPIRLDGALHSMLEKDAKANGRSLNAEIVRRLKQSYEIEERFGGPDMVDIVNLMAGAFMRGGKLGAQRSQHPEWTAAEWLRNPFCFAAAIGAVKDALIEAAPTPENLNKLDLIFGNLAGRGFNVERHEGAKAPEDGETPTGSDREEQ